VSAKISRVTACTGAPIDADRSDWSCGFAVVVAPGDGRSTEQWARAVWEEAPAPIRLFLIAGWRLVLGLRLGDRNSADHVLGWKIVHRLPNETAIEAKSRTLTAYNTFQRDDDRLIWSTFVRYDRPAARLIWPPVSLVHRPLVRYSLKGAARR
jgi:hypothetical protein